MQSALDSVSKTDVGEVGVYRLSRASVSGFWSRYEASASFWPDVNILIGHNGTGKTTFITLIQAALRADIGLLAGFAFDEIHLEFSDGIDSRSLTVTRYPMEDRPHDHALFEVGGDVFRFPMIGPDDSAYRMLRQPPQRRKDEYQQLKEQIAAITQVSSLSVHRSRREHPLEDDVETRRLASRYRDADESPVDRSLDGLLVRLGQFQHSLSRRAEEISTEFQRQVLVSMLYDETFDSYDAAEAAILQIGNEKEDLTRAYKQLNAFTSDLPKRINAHIAALQRSIRTARDYAVNKDEINFSDLVPLPLLRRTHRIIDLARRAEEQKQAVFQPLLQFKEIVHSFMRDKDVGIDSNGQMTVQKDERTLEASQLSSGEKQLLIILIETLLQQNAPVIFLADEPELSLHIEWQERIIESINKLNRNAQIVVATHSPEIAGGWSDRMIDMEDVVHA